MDYYFSVLQNYSNFNGRARRKEFWMFQLFNFLAIITVAIIDAFLAYIFDVPTLFLTFVYLLAVLIPGLAVLVRRMHDINKTGWMVLISFIPFIGGIWLLILEVTEGTIGANNYGADPKEDLI